MTRSKILWALILLLIWTPGFAGPYKNGVESYLHEDYKAARRHLEEAVRSQDEPEKARRLLSKVLIESAQKMLLAGDYDGARVLGLNARELFPDSPDLKAFEANLTLKGQVKPARKDPSYPRPIPPPLGRPLAEFAAPGAAERLHRGQGEGPPGPPPPPQRNQTPWPWIALAAAAAGVIAGYQYSLRSRPRTLGSIEKNQDQLLNRLDSLQDQIRRHDEEKLRLVRDLESRRASESVRPSPAVSQPSAQHPSPGAQRTLKEPPLSLAGPPARGLKGGDEAYRHIQARLNSLDKEPSPAGRRQIAQFQKKKILEILVKMTPDERREGQERIGVQAATLYEAYPREAVRFLNDLARDKSPLIRVGVICALVRVGAPALIGLLIELADDPEPDVKREALKAVRELVRGNLKCARPLSEGEIKSMTQVLSRELERQEWII